MLCLLHDMNDVYGMYWLNFCLMFLFMVVCMRFYVDML